MQIKWTPSARQSLAQIRSIHFTQQETKRYKIELVRKIEQKVAVVFRNYASERAFLARNL